MFAVSRIFFLFFIMNLFYEHLNLLDKMGGIELACTKRVSVVKKKLCFCNTYILNSLPPGEIFMPPKELWEAYSNRTVRPSVCPSIRPFRFRVRSISPIFFEAGISNLVCGCILGWRSVTFHFRVTVTLTSDLVFRIIVSGAYLLYYLR